MWAGVRCELTSTGRKQRQRIYYRIYEEKWLRECRERVVGQNGGRRVLSTQGVLRCALRDVAAVGILGDTTATDARKGVRAEPT